MFKLVIIISAFILAITAQRIPICDLTMTVITITPNTTMYFADCSQICFKLSNSVPLPSEAVCIAYSGKMIGYDFWVDQISSQQGGWLRSQYVFVEEPFNQKAGCICVKR